MYEACGAGFPEPTEYLRTMLQVTCADGTASEAWTYVYNWPVTNLPHIASGSFWKTNYDLKRHAHIDFALHKSPFLGGAEHADQFLEHAACSGANSNQVRKSKGSPRSRQ